VEGENTGPRVGRRAASGDTGDLMGAAVVRAAEPGTGPAGTRLLNAANEEKLRPERRQVLPPAADRRLNAWQSAPLQPARHPARPARAGFGQHVAVVGPGARGCRSRQDRCSEYKYARGAAASSLQAPRWRLVETTSLSAAFMLLQNMSSCWMEARR